MSKKILVLSWLCFFALPFLADCGQKPNPKYEVSTEVRTISEEDNIFASGKIYGVVTDKETGNPLVSASVYIVGTNFSATTNEIGEYYINVPAGKYTIKAAYISYIAIEIEDISVYAHKKTIMNFFLKTDVIKSGNIKN